MKAKLNNPLFVFIDTSKGARMPSAFVGLPGYNSHVQPKESMYKLLSKNNKVKLVGYDWSLQNKQKYLPTSKEVNFNKLDVILFNPVGRADKEIEFPAFHDDRPSITDNLELKKIILKRKKLLELKLFAKNNI